MMANYDSRGVIRRGHYYILEVTTWKVPDF